MTDVPYHKLEPGEMILRDYLAIERTVMANERSFLACLRTSLSLIVTGASFIKFSGYGSVEFIGWVLVSLGGMLPLVGSRRFFRMKRVIDTIKRGENIDQAT